MKKFIFSLFAAVLFTAAGAQKIHDPNAEVRAAANFHGISISNAFDVYLDQSGTEAVAVSAANEKDRDQIIVEVKDGILHIGLDKKLRLKTGNRKFKAYISFKNIDQLNVSGACDVFINGTLTANALALDLSGASDLKGKIEADKLSVELSGASDMVVSGRARQLHVDVSGASSFKGFDLSTEICHADASGASEINITVNGELSAEASGASDIRYRGNGVIRKMGSSGSGSVEKGR